jgi:RHS repeat-associated protein
MRSQQTYGFDAFGNIQSIGGAGARATSTSAATNRLSGAQYDAAGNVTSESGATYEYDPFHQMRRFQSGNEEWLYFYTADGQRIWSYQLGGSDRNRWTLRGLNGLVLREYESDHSGWRVAGDYIYRDGQLLAKETPGGGATHFHLDHLGTPRLLTDGSGQVSAYHAYYPFGEEATTAAGAERLKFTGHERDLGSAGSAGDDLDYMMARHHSPVTGRFLGVDPEVGSKNVPQSWNRYTYVLNRPMNLTDPSGRSWNAAFSLGADICAALLCNLTVNLDGFEEFLDAAHGYHEGDIEFGRSAIREAQVGMIADAGNEIAANFLGRNVVGAEEVAGPVDWVIGGVAGGLGLAFRGAVREGASLFATVVGSKGYAGALFRKLVGGRATKTMAERTTGRLVGVRTVDSKLFIRPKGGGVYTIEVVTEKGTQLFIHVQPKL